MPEQTQLKRTALKIGGMHCVGCVNSIQYSLSKIEGIKKFDINLATQKASIEFDPNVVELSRIETAIENTGYSLVYEKFSLKISGITDSSDAQNLEKKLSVDGIKEVSVNYGNSTVLIQYNSALLSLSDIRNLISKAGYGIISEDVSETAEELEAKSLKKLLFLGVVLTIPVLVLGYPEIFQFIPFAGNNYFAYVMFGCASIVQFAVGRRFYFGAFRIAKLKSANMDTLVVLGTSAAFLFSAYNTFPSVVWQNLYYDASALVITFIILGKYLENKTKGRTSSIIRKMLELQPKTATILQNNTELDIPIEQIKSGDIVIVKPGQKIPIDGIVVFGRSSVDESAITGESVPIGKKQDDPVIGGTVSIDGVLHIQALKVGGDTVLSQIVKLVEDAMSKKPPMQKMVDKVSGYFAFFVLISAVISFVGWYFFTTSHVHHFGASLIPSVAILVVACPCALGLATPTAVMVGMGKSARHGVLFKSGESLEMLGKIHTVVFDKTGTITLGKPQVTDVIPVSISENQLIELASIAEKNSEHPIANAILAKAKQENIVPAEADDFGIVPGKGTKARHGDRLILVGNSSFVRQEGVVIEHAQKNIDKLEKEGKTVILVSLNSNLVGIIAIFDTPRKEAGLVMKNLKKRGINLIMLTGDNSNTANTIAKEIGIDTVFANVLPDQKAEVISKLQMNGAKIAMVGDGINDAAALTVADIGIAMGAGTDLAIEAGKVILIRNDLKGLLSAFDISKKTISKIKQNLAYAFLYNVVLIPLAGFGMLYPAIAGLAMAASSISVTGSSLMLKRWTPKIDSKGLDYKSSSNVLHTSNANV